MNLLEDTQILTNADLLTAIGACRDAMPETAARVNDAIADPLAVPAYVRESVSLLVSQRNELLQALKDIAEESTDPGAFACARAAIAKAGGEA